MTIGSGLASQIGFATETTVGTPATVTRFFPYDSESLKLKRTIKQGSGLRAGAQVDLASRRAFTTIDVNGDIQMDFPAKGAGILLQHMLGSFSATAVQQAASAAYQQVHILAPAQGKTLTVQKGVPKTDGSGVEPFTYPGGKVQGWEIDCAQGDIVKLKLTMDAMNELTTATTPAGPALASASYTASTGVFTFTQGALVSGGTVSQTAGVWSLTGGTAVAAVRSVNVKGTTGLKADRYFLGSQTKAEQVQNAMTQVGGQLDVEFANRALYDQYRADGSAALQLTFTGPIIASTYAYVLQFLFPVACLEDGASPSVGGPDIVTTTVPFTALTNDSAPAVQAIYQTTDTAV
ncbi:MAG: phage tail tube protein [Mycobacteriaceae bacterium]